MGYYHTGYSYGNGCQQYYSRPQPRRQGRRQATQCQPVYVPQTVSYAFEKNGKQYRFQFNGSLNQQQLQALYQNADYYHQLYNQPPIPTPRQTQTPTQPPQTTQTRQPVPQQRVTQPPVTQQPITRPEVKRSAPPTPTVPQPERRSEPVQTPRPQSPVNQPESKPITTPPVPENRIPPQPPVKKEPVLPRPESPTPPAEDLKIKHLKPEQKAKYTELQNKIAALKQEQSQIPQELTTISADLAALPDQEKAAIERLEQSLSRRHEASSMRDTSHDLDRLKITYHAKKRELEERKKSLEARQEEIPKLLSSFNDETFNYLSVPKSQKLQFGSLQQADRWPSNTQMVGSASEGQYSFMTRFSRTLENQAKKTNSLPEAIAETERHPILGDNSETQRPVSSPQTVSGWKKTNTTTPRKVLIIRGGHHKESDQSGIAKDAETYQRMMAQEYGVPAENITILDADNHAKIEAEMQKMKTFSEQNPGAEAAVMLVGHGWGVGGSSNYEPGLSSVDREKEGAARGNFWLSGTTHLREAELKRMFNTYLSGYSSVIGICNSCSSGSWIADTRHFNQTRPLPA